MRISNGFSGEDFKTRKGSRCDHPANKPAQRWIDQDKKAFQPSFLIPWFKIVFRVWGANVSIKRKTSFKKPNVVMEVCSGVFPPNEVEDVSFTDCDTTLAHINPSGRWNQLVFPIVVQILMSWVIWKTFVLWRDYLSVAMNSIWTLLFDFFLVSHFRHRFQKLLVFLKFCTSFISSCLFKLIWSKC